MFFLNFQELREFHFERIKSSREELAKVFRDEINRLRQDLVAERSNAAGILQENAEFQTR